MLDLPKSTEFNKRIPKQKFYEQLDISSVIKRSFVEQIKVIFWRNKIAATTLNVSIGERVTEVEVFEVRLSVPALDEMVLRQIDREIPYHIIFVLEYNGKFQAWTGYKEISESGKNAFKVNRYYHTEWLTEDKLPLHLDGLNIDTIYDNFFRQVAGDAFQVDTSDSLKDTVEKDEKRLLLNKQIEALQTKIRKEKQLNKQVQMNTELKKLRKELEELNVY